MFFKKVINLKNIIPILNLFSKYKNKLKQNNNNNFNNNNNSNFNNNNNSNFNNNNNSNFDNNNSNFNNSNNSNFDNNNSNFNKFPLKLHICLWLSYFTLKNERKNVKKFE